MRTLYSYEVSEPILMRNLSSGHNSLFRNERLQKFRDCHHHNVDQLQNSEWYRQICILSNFFSNEEKMRRIRLKWNCIWLYLIALFVCEVYCLNMIFENYLILQITENVSVEVNCQTLLWNWVSNPDNLEGLILQHDSAIFFSSIQIITFFCPFCN